MSHLLAGLLRMHDLWTLGMALLQATAGSIAAFHLVTRASHHAGSWRQGALFGLVNTLLAWIVFRTALQGSFPQLALQTPWQWAAGALMLALTGLGCAGLVHRRGRRSARNTMLAGSLAASGISCMLFTAMAGLVRPFALAYDLSAVLVAMVAGSALYGFALWESANPDRRHARIVAPALASAALLALVVGSLAAILPFDGWMATLAKPDDLSSTPLAIVVATEAAAVLALSLFGSLVDNRAAARDRLETERLRQLAGSTFEAIVIHRGGVVLDGNDVLAELVNLSLPALLGNPVARLWPAAEPWPSSDTAPARLPAQAKLMRMDGEAIPVEVLSRQISYGGHPAVATALRDVRERRASEARIRFMAHHDILTELPNRALLNETMTEALDQCRRTGESLGVLCLDLDGFKLVNDTLGHAAGDKLLCEVARRLQSSLRATDFVARIGGDEFVVLNASGVQPAQSTQMAQHIVECLSLPFVIDGKDVRIGTSVGIALYPQDSGEAPGLLKQADIALYRAKHDGRGTFCLFESGMDLVLQQQRTMELALRVAIEHDALSVEFQPLFDRKRRLVCFEALSRWHHPELGTIPPIQFIPLAEACGLIVALGEHVLRKACLAAQRWPDRCRVAVNLSPVQFLRSDLVATVAMVLHDTGLPATRLELEITEGVLIANREGTLATLNSLRAMGVRLVLDDFGTGYSSLSYLHQFPFDKLKIDRSFVERLETDSAVRAIVRAIISMSRNLKLEVTAEGVETAGQFDMLCDEGCHEVQGYLLGRPMKPNAIHGFAGWDAERGTTPPEGASMVLALQE